MNFITHVRRRPEHSHRAGCLRVTIVFLFLKRVLQIENGVSGRENPFSSSPVCFENTEVSFNPSEKQHKWSYGYLGGGLSE